MQFHSTAFCLFFPAVVALHFMLPHRFRWAVLLAASYFFYMYWRPAYGMLLLACTGINYYAALAMERQAEERGRRKYLILSLAASLGLLCSFKYLHFLSASLAGLLAPWGLSSPLPAFDWVLPVGLSFYTLQALSYTIDVYRGQRPPETHFGIFALYISFFPQLVIGPIERSSRLLPQFREEHAFDADRLTDGLRLMLWGYFKKLVVADNLAGFVETAYGAPDAYQGLPLVLATWFFSFQIYCDFSGYCDVALGAARILGFSLTRNFDNPFAAESVPDFWRRWNISVSSWFRDYLYLPLAGVQAGPLRRSLGLLVTFALIGLWHGPAWTFVAWGAVNGAYIIGSLWTRPLRWKLADALGALGQSWLRRLWRSFFAYGLVCASLIFFRADSLATAAYVATHLWTGVAGQLADLRLLDQALLSVGWSRLFFAGALAGTGFLYWMQFQPGGVDDMGRLLGARPRWQRWLAYYAMIFGIFFFGRFGEREFLYFQF